MEFVPNESFGLLKYHMSVQEAIDILGKPDEYIDKDEDGGKTLRYYNDMLILYFYEMYNYTLSLIDIEKGEIPLTYKDKDFFKLKYKEIIILLGGEQKITDREIHFEDQGEDYDEEEVTFDELGITLYFDNKKNLMEVNLYKRVEEDE